MKLIAKNVLTGHPLTGWQAKRLKTLRELRSASRKPARSGNPAISAPARRILTSVPHAIRETLLGVARP